MKLGLSALTVFGVVILAASRGTAANPSDAGKGTPSDRVDFSYAFAMPHRLTAARPDSGDKTLVDVLPGSLALGWTYNSMATLPAHAAWGHLRTVWHASIVPQIDRHPLGRQTYSRAEGGLPVLQSVFQDKRGTAEFEAAACASALVCRVRVRSTGDKPQVFSVVCTATQDLLNRDASRGAERCDVFGVEENRLVLVRIGGDAAPLVWTLQPGESKTGWIIRPYRAHAADLPSLRGRDWEQELGTAKKEWTDLLARAVRMQIPDAAVESAFRACLADLFVMREPVQGGGVAGTAGTEVYRGFNTWEPGLAAVALDEMGLHQEAEAGFRSRIEQQLKDGLWEQTHPTFFCATGLKAWVAMEHYRLTGDRDYLAKVYPRMRDSARWHELQRAQTRRLENGKRTSSYGMLVGGLTDCGMSDPTGRALYYSHNIWSVFGDRLAVEAARILGKTGDLAELEGIAARGHEDLVKSMEMGAIQANGYRWLSGAPDNAAGSQWEVLNALSPCRLLPADHPLITGSIRHMESNMSPGGLPLHTGYMADGMWVAITLEGLGEAHLARGDGDAFARYLYPVLNHATPLVTWCEERGKEAGSPRIGGDRQHLYTPAAVVRALRDALVLEDEDGIRLALGTPRPWLASGKPVGIAKAPTHFGPVSYQMQYDAARSRVVGEATFAEGREPAWVVLHIRLPRKLRVTAVDAASGATVLPGGEGLRWSKPRGTVRFEATVGAL